MSRLFPSGLKRLTLLLILSAIFSFGLDITLTSFVRPNLSVLAALLLAHVMPTFFLAFRDFDQQTELWERTVYANSGPIGFGFFMGSMAHGVLQDPRLPEGVTASAICMTLVAILVAFSYWSSGTMSRASLSSHLEKVPYPRAATEFVWALKAHRYHVLAAKGQEAIIDGEISQLLEPDGWFENVSRLLKLSGYSEVKIQKARLGFERMAAELEPEMVNS